MFYVIKKGKNDLTLFLIDRTKSKSKWWTTDLIDAMCFKKESAARYSAARLKYGEIDVVSLEDARKIEDENDYNIAMIEDFK